MLTRIFTLAGLLLFFGATAQVTTNYNSTELTDARGKFQRDYRPSFYEIATPDTSVIMAKDRASQSTDYVKPFRFAEPVPVDINVAEHASWVTEGERAYFRLSIRIRSAKSLSINFSEFSLPANTEMYIYNEDGSMITGPVTEKENNTSNTWGSDVYKGEIINVEGSVPSGSVKELQLRVSNIAFGYREIFKSKIYGFGNSGSCNINVLCPEGTGWAAERSSVALILEQSGSYWCTGALVNNTCGVNVPFFLTANHCLDNGTQNVTQWRFVFQRWSSTCSPSQDNAGTLYNGSTLRATNAASDFALLELSQRPPANSGLALSGWSRSSTPASNATAIHHPRGDVMKISKANNPVSRASYGGSVNQHWRADWSQGVTEPGSSGSPLYDQDHRIVGQLHGGPSYCGSSQLWDFYGSFDQSWTGGGTSATRLSDWLDVTNTGATTTNTSYVSTMFPNANHYISGPAIICNSAVYSLANLPAGATVTWSIPSSAGSVLQLAQNTPSANQVTITNQKWYGVATTLTASVNICGYVINITKNIANDNDNSASTTYNYYQEACYFYNVSHPYESGTVTTNSSPKFVHQGCTVYVTLGNLNTYNKTVTFVPTGSSSVSNPIFWYFNNNQLVFQLPYGSGGIPFTFKITGDGACYEKTLLFFSISNNGRAAGTSPEYTFNIAPNPVNDVLTVQAKAAKSPKTVAEKLSARSLQFTCNIYDVNSTMLLMTRRSVKGSTTHRINTATLKPGLYILEVVRNGEKQTIHFRKE
ncbi:MAG TPA: trypsin-like peptidase domain-containing protein [Flavisolibacter sp.]|jgi:hypothetical protein